MDKRLKKISKPNFPIPKLPTVTLGTLTVGDTFWYKGAKFTILDLHAKDDKILCEVISEGKKTKFVKGKKILLKRGTEVTLPIN